MDEVVDPKKMALSKNETKVIKIIFVIILIYVIVTIFGIQLISNDFKNYFIQNGELIITMSIIIFSFIILFSIYDISLKDNKRKLKKKVVIESFNSHTYNTDNTNERNNDNNNVLDNNIIKTLDKLDVEDLNVSFCNSQGSLLEKNINCKKLTKNNCTTVGCCVLLNGEKCVGGNENGPTYLNEDNKDLDVQYYIYKDSCKGKCPN